MWVSAAPAPSAEGREWQELVGELRAFAAAERPWTLEISDPLSLSFVGRRAGAAPSDPDPQLEAHPFARGAEEEEALGLVGGGGGGAAADAALDQVD